jgi:transcriptional regulator with XRE-family HTH domain
MDDRTGRLNEAVNWLLMIGIANSKRKLAELLKCSDSTLSRKLGGKAEVSDKFIRRVCKLHKALNEEWLAGGKGEMLKKDVPIQPEGKPQECQMKNAEVNAYLKEAADTLQRLYILTMNIHDRMVEQEDWRKEQEAALKERDMRIEALEKKVEELMARLS